MPPLISIAHHILAGTVAAHIRLHCRNGTADTLSWAALTRRFAVSETKLKAILRRRYRTGLHAFIIKERMRYITELLETTNLPLKAVAAMAGYPGRSNFSCDFTLHAGISPMRYR